MNKVFLVKDVESIVLDDNPEDTYLVYHEMYAPPEMNDVEYIEFQKFKGRYFDLHANRIIFVGLNRMITPSNRCEMVNDYMQNMTRNIDKVSIDTAPFIGEPWRLFFHWDVTNNDQFGLPHSYAMETEWKHWFLRDVNDCRFAGKNISKYLTKTYSDLELLSASISYSDRDDAAWYKEAKEHSINKHNTPKLMINELLKMCNKRYGLKIRYDDYLLNSSIDLPDNNLYRFVGEEINRRRDIYNGAIKCGRSTKS